MKEYYIRGTEAYAPIPVEVPSHLPEDPKKAQAQVPQEKSGVSFLTVLGTVVILTLFVGLLVTMAHLFEARSERAELLRRKAALEARQEQLITRFESGIDMDVIAKRAEELGMHIPWADQVHYEYIEEHQAEGEGQIP